MLRIYIELFMEECFHLLSMAVFFNILLRMQKRSLLLNIAILGCNRSKFMHLRAGSI